MQLLIKPLDLLRSKFSYHGIDRNPMVTFPFSQITRSFQYPFPSYDIATTEYYGERSVQYVCRFYCSESHQGDMDAFFAVCSHNKGSQRSVVREIYYSNATPRCCVSAFDLVTCLHWMCVNSPCDPTKWRYKVHIIIPKLEKTRETLSFSKHFT